MKRMARIVTAALLSLALVAGSAISAAAAPPPHAGNPHRGPGHGQGFMPPGQAKKVREEKPAQFKQQFSDWDDKFWAADSLGRMILRGIIVGDGGKIHAQRHVTRLEALITLMRLYAWEQPDGDGSEFDEEVPDWGLDAALGALLRGILQPLPGKGKSYGLQHKLSRLDAAVLLVRAAGLDEEARDRAGETLGFKDQNAIPADYRGYVAVAVEQDFIKGYPNGVFQPNRLVTRAEWTALLARLEDKQPPPADEDEDEKTNVRGTIVAVATGANASLTLREQDAEDDVTYRFADEYDLFLDGKPAKLADIKPGDNVWVYLNASDEIVWASVTSRAERVVTGKVVSTGGIPGRWTLTLDTGAAEVVLELAHDVLIEEQGDFNLEIPLDALQAGDEVTVTVVDGKAMRVTRTKRAIATVELTGVVSEVSSSGDSFVLTIGSGDNAVERYVSVTAATVFTLNGEAADASALTEGAEATVKAVMESNRLTASQVDLTIGDADGDSEDDGGDADDGDGDGDAEGQGVDD